MNTKKLISLLLVVCMLCSMGTAVFATTDYRNGTDVTYNPADPDGIPDSGDEVDNESYIITVPAKLLPGTEGPVTLEGTWASNRVVTVTAEPSVEMVNSINANDTKTLKVTFAGISEKGDNEKSQKFVENVKVAEITNALFGTWSGHFEYQVGVESTSLSIPVQATDKNGNDLNATSTEIVGQDKTILLDKLEESGIVASGTNVDALIEVESDEFEDLAETTFDVSEIAKPGDKVVILHYNEETQEWEYIGEGIVQEDGTVTASFSSYSPVGFVVIKDDGTTEDTYPLYFSKYYELIGDIEKNPQNGAIKYASGFVFHPDGSWEQYWDYGIIIGEGTGFIQYVGNDLCVSADKADPTALFVYATLSEDKTIVTLYDGKQMRLCSDPELRYDKAYEVTMEEDGEIVNASMKFNADNTVILSVGGETNTVPFTKISNRIFLDDDAFADFMISDNGLIVFNDDVQAVYPSENAKLYLEEAYSYTVVDDGETYTMSAILHADGSMGIYSDGELIDTCTYEIQGCLFRISSGDAFVITDNGNTLSMLTMERGLDLIIRRVNG